MHEYKPDLVAEMEIATALVGGPIESLEPVGGGRNSRVFHVRTTAREFALKQYPPRADDPRDRLGTEARALTIMERHGFAMVPRLIGTDPARGFALLSWLDAAPLGEVREADIDWAASFLAAIHELQGDPAVSELPLASEACLSGREIERQIEGRLTRLRQVAEEDRRLRCFLDERFALSLGRLLARAKGLMEAAGCDFAAMLPPENRCLAPSDFGFHNSLRRHDGSLVFFDFEYFGWDDPVKLTADVMLHPGTPVASRLTARFARRARMLYGGDGGFADRLRAFYPLFALRWVLILLNEFLPDHWRRRVTAGASGSWDDAKERQLARARAMLTRFEGFEDGYEIDRRR